MPNRIGHSILRAAQQLGLLRAVIKGMEALQAAKCWFMAGSGAARREAADGVPLPPLRLIAAVGGTADRTWFLRGGGRAAETIVDTLARHGIDVDQFDAILDFGCGAGRVIRHWRGLRHARLYGTDCNATVVGWCRSNLRFARFATNSLDPPLCYADEVFDFVYALSVFTHLPEPLQLSWMKDLGRVLKPGGYLLITTHGEWYLRTLSAEQQRDFRTGHLVVCYEEAAGTNLCGAFHPRSYVREKLARGFDLVDFIPEGARGNPHQDCVLLRKPSAAMSDGH